MHGETMKLEKLMFVHKYANQSHEWGSDRWCSGALVVLPYVSVFITVFGKMRKF